MLYRILISNREADKVDAPNAAAAFVLFQRKMVPIDRENLKIERGSFHESGGNGYAMSKKGPIEILFAG